MLSISEMIEKFPSAEMDSQKQTISIPIQEYENYRNILALQDKQSIIRDLQKLLLNKEEDLKRYKEKCQLQEAVLQRTQKALDKSIQSETLTSIPLKMTSRPQARSVVQLKRSDAKPKSVNMSGAMEVVSRAVGDESSKTSTSTLPDPASRSGLIEDSSSIRSLPPSLSVGSPGMSTALLRRLVQENLKLKAQLEKRQGPKGPKNAEEFEKTINDLKIKLSKKQKLVDDLLNQSGSGGEAAARIEALHKENNDCKDTMEMDKIVINALKQENTQCRKDKEEMENLLKQYRQFKITAEEKSDRVAELERQLREEVDSKASSESKTDLLKSEVERLKKAVETAEGERDLAVKNYNTLCSQYHKSSPQPAFINQAPPLSSQPASLPQQPYNFSQSIYGDTTRVLSRGPQSPGARQYPDSATSHFTPKMYPVSKPVTQPMQESTGSSRMAQSMFAAPSPASTQSPMPTERKTFKCPRCDTKFMVLQSYRDHIKICLKG